MKLFAFVPVHGIGFHPLNVLCGCVGEDLLEPADEQQLLARLQGFAEEALVTQQAGSPLMAALVRKLLEGLASVERFPVQYSQLGAPNPSLRAFGSLGTALCLRCFVLNSCLKWWWHPAAKSDRMTPTPVHLCCC